MKIFAKRKRKAVDTTTGSDGKAARSVFKSDPVVEKLLKQDPSTWNAKQRRMVKRYQDRKDDMPDDLAPEEVGSDGDEVRENASVSGTDSEGEDPSGAEKGNEDEEKEEGDDAENKVGEHAPVKEKDQEEELVQVTETERKPVDPQPSGTTKDNRDEEKEEGDDAANKAKDEKEELVPVTKSGQKPVDPELQKLLDKLSSKPRRKLTRSLERGGNAAEIKSEALSLLGIKEEAVAKIARESEQPTKKRRRRGPADLSSLPPDERLRREEQRRLQKEAAERRNDDGGSQHKHPLNSERRRANRRKPKHAKKQSKPWGPNEHDTSGFHMRRVKKGLPS